MYEQSRDPGGSCNSWLEPERSNISTWCSSHHHHHQVYCSVTQINTQWKRESQWVDISDFRIQCTSVAGSTGGETLFCPPHLPALWRHKAAEAFCKVFTRSVIGKWTPELLSNKELRGKVGRLLQCPKESHANLGRCPLVMSQRAVPCQRLFFPLRVASLQMLLH